ncbi:MAG: SusC/RagA family TonB-linked outer membrane protein [Cyclobacteriaceae bacterium]|nr:SusC/RagA family TonB-linked outer membrane protein [Cyclobacteriaceae bacterium]
MKKTLQFIKLMSRLVFYGMIFQIICFSMLLANKGDAQVNLSANSISMDLRQVNLNIKTGSYNLQEIFELIEQNTDFKFFYDKKTLRQSNAIQLEAGNSSLYQILLEISRQSSLHFKQVNKNINVKIIEKAKDDVDWIEISKLEQAITITGRVTSSDSPEGLPGVNVIVKGTSQGTVTDIQGRYSLEIPANGTVLVFSSVGYILEEVEVGSRSVIDITLTADITSLDEIVVVGFGTQNRRDLTGSVSSADLDAFKEAPNVNLLQSLQGAVPGIQIGQVNQAGQEPSLSVRGETTLSGNRNAVIVVDGIIYRGRIGDINPNDVKSVDILKDASSTAVYGAQAANGVILITTKSGRSARKPSITYNSYVSTSSPTVDAGLLGREGNLQKVRDVEFRNAYLAPDYTVPNPDWDFNNSELNPPHMQGVANGTDYDWWSELTSPGYINDHNLGISGGSENSSYFLSGGYTDQTGFITNDKYKRATVRINLETDVNQWLTLGTNSFGSFTDFSGNTPNFRSVAFMSPLIVPRDENGEFIINPAGNNDVNPFLAPSADDSNLSSNISSILYGIVKVPGINGLTYRINFSNNIRSTNHSYSNVYDAGLTGVAFKNLSSTRDQMLDNIVNYENKFGDHSLNLTLLSGFNKVQFERTNARSQNFSNLNLSYNSLQQGTIPLVSSGAYDETLIYQMGRVNYNYLSRYLITATLRRDGYSGFSRNNKTALFPSIGLGWVMSEESFFSTGLVDFLKIRASYGKNGNQTSRYSSLARVRSGEDLRYVFGDGAPTIQGQAISSLANNDLRWETTLGLNLGMDFDLLKGRINGSMEFYHTKTSDLLWAKVLPRVSGFNTIQTNLGELENTGFELNIGASPIKTNDLQWNFNFVFSTNDNRIVTLLGEDSDGDGKEDDLVASGLFIGKSIGTIYNYELDGIWQLNDEVPNGFFPGTYRIVDQNGDGQITPEDDRVFLGRREPAYRFGIQNTVLYKNFSLRFFINSIQGGKDGYKSENHPTGVAQSPGAASNSNFFGFYDYWSTVNPNGSYPQTWLTPLVSPVNFVQRNFIRLQDISIGYDFGSRFKEKLQIDGMRVFISGKNLLTLTDWDGWDPETGQGIGIANAFPVMKTYTAGFEITF